MTPREVVARWEAAEATGDADTERALLTEDFLAVGPVGFVLDARAWCRRHDDGLAVESLSIEVGSVREYGDSAVVVGIQTQRGTYRGRRTDGRFRITLVLGVEDGWRVRGLHLSGPIPEGVP